MLDKLNQGLDYSSPAYTVSDYWLKGANVRIAET
jgi:hypothetical protein